MNRTLSWGKREWPTLLVIALGIAIQIFLITRPLDFLLTNLLPDDAFYYFGIARNIVHGLGSTFDGLNMTNGYHPLWLIILLPIFKFFSVGGVADIAPVYVLLVVSVAMNAITALVVARILSRFTRSEWVRAFGIFVWMLNPFLLYETLNGLETSLALLFFAIFFLLALRIEEERSIGGYWLLGIVAGLMILARLDMAIYFAAFLGWIFVRQGWSGWRTVLWTGFWGALVVSPWIIWNFVQFHTLLTSSSSAEQMVNHQLIVQDHGPSLFQTLKAVIYNTQYFLVDLFQRTGVFSIALGFIGAACALFFTNAFPKLRRKEFPATLALFGGFILLFILNASIRWTVREWYFVSFDLFIAILVVIVADKLFPYIHYKKSVGALLLALTIFSFAVDWSKDLRDAMAQQEQMYDAAQWMNANLPAGTRVGVFNAGIQGYFSDVRVINLDGLVNNAAYEAMRERALWPYVLNTNIAYISDFDEYLTYRYKSFFGQDPYQDLTLVQSISASSTTSAGAPVNIYRIKRAP